MKYNVPDMSCGHCRASIETAVKAADPAAKIAFDQDMRQVDINSGLDTRSVISVLDKAGYPASPV